MTCDGSEYRMCSRKIDFGHNSWCIDLKFELGAAVHPGTSHCTIIVLNGDDCV